MSRPPLLLERLERDCGREPQPEPPVDPAPADAPAAEPLDGPALAYTLLAALGCLGLVLTWLTGARVWAGVALVLAVAGWIVVSGLADAPALDGEP